MDTLTVIAARFGNQPSVLQMQHNGVSFSFCCDVPTVHALAEFVAAIARAERPKCIVVARGGIGYSLADYLASMKLPAPLTVTLADVAYPKHLQAA